MEHSLYRKYRPRLWKEVVGQPHIRLTLQNEILTGRLAHAYLFTGPRGVGKTTVGRLLAKAINCERRPADSPEPCNECGVCSEINSGASLDLVEIDAASHTGVDNVRENIIANSRVSPTRYRYKVFLIDEVHMLSLSAFNALLKTLEEPPRNVLFILATTEAHRVPQTIVSRCQQFQFHTIPHEDLVKRLKYIAESESRDIDNDVLEAVARQSGGYARDAESTLSQIFALGETKITLDQASLILPRSDMNLVLEFFLACVHENAGDAVALLGRLIEEGVDLQQFGDDLTRFLRNILLCRVNIRLDHFAEMGFSTPQQEEILKEASLLSLRDLLFLIDVFREARREIRPTELILQFPLELALMKYLARERASSLTPPVEAGKSAPAAAPVQSVAGEAPHTAVDGKKWSAVMTAVKEKNHSLYLTLQTGRPISFVNGTVTVGFGYRFHCDRMMEQKNTVVIEEVLATVYGTPLKFRCAVDESARSKREEKNEVSSVGGSLVGDALQAFGGSVVEEAASH